MSRRTYATEFPDFGELDVTLPAGFVDMSWKNETCPRFVGHGLYVWIDYKDPAKRELIGFPRFNIANETDDDGEQQPDLLQTDDWDKVLRFIKEHCKPSCASGVTSRHLRVLDLS